MSASSDSSRLADAAVVDVGSNSVRLVMYRLDGRAIWTVFNEKTLAGLGRDISLTGRLAPAGVEAAIVSLARYSALIAAARPKRLFAVGTAALRIAADGAAFRDRVLAETGLNLRVLTGEQEARYAALGVLAGAPSAAGVVGDLGGGSLELIRLQHGAPGAGITLRLGPFWFPQPFRPAIVEREVERTLERLDPAFACATFNAVGGAWRNLALLHMRLADYPLGIIHQYELTRADALAMARFVAQQSRGSLERIEGISRRRVEGLPHAAVVLAGLINQLGFKRIVLSAYGLREGLILGAMTRAARRRDPLIEGFAALAGRPETAETFGAALTAWLSGLFARLKPVFGEREATLIAAACRLADFGAQLHPDHRADLVFEQVLRAPVAGMDHAERAFLACAAFGRHTASPNMPSPELVTRLLSPERYQRARALGGAVRLGCELAGRSAALLTHARLNLKGGALVLQADSGWEAMLLGDQIAKRAATLASLLESELKLKQPASTPARVSA